MDYKVAYFEKHSDKRGELVVFLKSSELKKSAKRFGQIYFITFNRRGTVRGNHYHKKWREWFGVIEGKVKVELEDLRSGKCASLILDAQDKHYVRLEIGPYIAHGFKSLSSQVALLNYADKEWSPKDRFAYEVCKVR